MQLSLKIIIIVFLKLMFLIWIKITYFSPAVDMSTGKMAPTVHLFNISTSKEEKKDD